MRFHVFELVAFTFVMCPALISAQDEELVPLFNGHDLEGWVNVNCAPETFTVRDEMIVSTGKPTGVMRTAKQYENFILELEWRHMQPQGNAGLFVWSDAITARGVPFTRSLEVQILDGRTSEDYTSHGDIFSIHGATFVPDRPHPKGWERCLPSEHRCHPAGEWNHYRVVCRDGVIKLSVNGKEVSGGSESNPRKGYICLESEGSECHFRNIRIAELPGGNATEEQTATKDEGFRSLYNGLDLRGWKTDSDRWQAKDWVLFCDAGDNNLKSKITSETELTEGEFQFDFRCSDANESNKSKSLEASWPEFQVGQLALGVFDKGLMRPLGEWNRIQITLTGGMQTVTLNGKLLHRHVRSSKGGSISIRAPVIPTEFANLYVRQADQ